MSETLREGDFPRFWAKVNVGEPDECWPWTACLNHHGYGRFNVRGHCWLSHRFAWVATNGAVPEGSLLDHLCRNRACVNPAHMELVDAAENVRRGLKGRLVTHCPQGHAYDAVNTYIRSNGTRMCRTCTRERGAVLRRKAKLA